MLFYRRNSNKRYFFQLRCKFPINLRPEKQIWIFFVYEISYHITTFIIESVCTTHWEIDPEFGWFKPNLNCNYLFFDRFSPKTDFRLVLNQSEKGLIRVGEHRHETSGTPIVREKEGCPHSPSIKFHYFL